MFTTSAASRDDRGALLARIIFATHPFFRSSLLPDPPLLPLSLPQYISRCTMRGISLSSCLSERNGAEYGWRACSHRSRPERRPDREWFSHGLRGPSSHHPVTKEATPFVNSPFSETDVASPPSSPMNYERRVREGKETPRVGVSARMRKSR